MAAIGRKAADQLIADAESVGLTAEQVANHVRTRVEYLDGISRADARRVEQHIVDVARRRQVEERTIHLAGLLGKDRDVVRGQVGQFQTGELEKMIADTERHLRRKGVDIRTEDEKQTAAAAPATQRQVDYIVSLLAKRRRDGNDAGFAPTRRLYRADGTVDADAVRQLTRSSASTLIDSLTENY